MKKDRLDLLVYIIKITFIYILIIKKMSAANLSTQIFKTIVHKHNIRYQCCKQNIYMKLAQYIFL